MTVSVWVYWNGLNGKYPNVLTGGWNPGGFMFFVNEDNLSFRLGRRGHRAGKVGDRWEEGSCGMQQEYSAAEMDASGSDIQLAECHHVHGREEGRPIRMAVSHWLY